jgi:hypothetical protein
MDIYTSIPDKLLVTGSRHWDDVDMVEEVLGIFRHRRLTLVHGDAPGLDRIAATIWIGWGKKSWPHRARWRLHGNAAGPIRNQEMVDRGGFTACLAFPLGVSRGTRDCMRRAEAAGISVFEAPFTPEVVTEMASLHRRVSQKSDRE